MTKNRAPAPPPPTSISGDSMIPKMMRVAADLLSSYQVISFRKGAITGTTRNGDILIVHLSKSYIRLRKPAIITIDDQFTFVVRRPKLRSKEILELDTQLSALKVARSIVVSGRDFPDWFPRPD